MKVFYCWYLLMLMLLVEEMMMVMKEVWVEEVQVDED
jgi:hypothetical protein